MTASNGQLIIAADDYGIRETSKPILALAQRGKLDRVGVLVHFTSPDEAAALLETGVQIDIHLELIDFLKSGDQHARAGVFGRGFNFVWRYAFSRETARQVEEQWESQVLRFHELFGRFPDGFNSHEHVHYFPVFFRVFMKLADRYHIPYIRFGTSGIFRGEQRGMVAGILSVLRFRNLSLFKASGLHSSEWMTSFDWLASPQPSSWRLPSGTVEVVVHPERADEYQAILEHF